MIVLMSFYLHRYPTSASVLKIVVLAYQQTILIALENEKFEK